MADLVVIVPSRGRPERARALAEAFKATCTADTHIALALDLDDPKMPSYQGAVEFGIEQDDHDVTSFTSSNRVMLSRRLGPVRHVVTQESGTMVSAVNKAAGYLSTMGDIFAIGFMGDDHLPRTVGWDEQYLAALREMGTGIVYGNDLLQGHRLPTQCAMTSDIVRAVGYMAPPVLKHLYVDDAWLTWGKALDRLRYLKDVIVEHRHPVAGKAMWDENYARVNSSEVAEHDLAAFEAYKRDQLDADLAKIRAIMSVAA